MAGRDGDTVEIITERLSVDGRGADPDEASAATHYHRVFVNGIEVRNAAVARVFTSSDFSFVTLRIFPGHLIVRDVASDEFHSYQPEVIL